MEVFLRFSEFSTDLYFVMQKQFVFNKSATLVILVFVVGGFYTQSVFPSVARSVIFEGVQLHPE